MHRERERCDIRLFCESSRLDGCCSRLRDSPVGWMMMGLATELLFRNREKAIDSLHRVSERQLEALA